ncbi:MAG: hypothetical protein IPI58_04670 [Alphaproteobacteria bacterium]|nr:MAG: hypothetical protein IPI58_04670 [Alphaproteobacteria bacterium]
MLDFNHGSDKPPQDPRALPIAVRINELVDTGLIAERQKQPRREYLGASMLGDPCSRRIQYEYVGAPKDQGKDFNGQTLRIFDAGHQFEALSVKWLRGAGFDLRTEKADGGQFGFSVAKGRIKGHIDGVIVGGPSWFVFPSLWEHKALKDKSWQDLAKRGLAISKPLYAAQVALYQGYMPDLARCPALFTALNKDTQELYHELVPFDASLAQSTSDKAVNILQATDAGQQLPRIAANPDFYLCLCCPYAKRCWHGA